VAVLVLLAGLDLAIQADEPPKTETPPAKQPDKIGDKTVTFAMDGKPWSSVLEWLVEQTGLPLISKEKPTGTFTFVAPKDKKYTIPQVVDILNNALTTQKFILIRREQSWTLVAADDKIDPAILPQVTPEDLNDRGETEIVAMLLPLRSLVAEDVVKEIDEMVGPFGKAIALPSSNQIWLQDTVKNIKRITKNLKDTEQNEAGKAESFSHECKYIKATEAERVLKELLGDPRELLRLTQPQQQQQGGGFRGGFQPGFQGFQGGFPGGTPQPPQAAPAAGATPKIRLHYITVNERLNTVLVTGPADKIAQAKAILAKIDVPRDKEEKPVLTGPPVLKKYPVPAGNAEALAKLLQDTYKNSPSVRISNVGTGSIMVWGGPAEQFEINDYINGGGEKNERTELIPMGSQDATKIADQLTGMFGDVKTGAPYIKADTDNNAVVVRGTQEQINEIKAAVKAMGGTDEAGGVLGNTRVITLDKGGAAALAETLERLLPQMRKNPIKVIGPDSGTPKPEPPKEKDAPPAKDKDGKQTSIRPIKLNADDPQLQDPQQTKPKNGLPGKETAPITIMAVGNRVIITSDDPEALALVQQLTHLLTQSSDGKGDFEIIRLKNASATDAAKVLDEVFNGKPQNAQGPQGPGFGFNPFARFAAQGAQPPANPTPNRIRVVADAGSNSLLVQASPIDMLTIRRLLDKAIDSGVTDSQAVMRTWIIGPLKYSSASQVADTIKDVFREQTNNNPLPTNGRGFRGFGFPGANNANLDANGNPRGVSLSVGVDERTNSLILNCSEAMKNDIQTLIDSLESAGKDSTRSVKVLSVKGIDPDLVQQAVQAIQGRSQGSGTSGGGFSPFGGGFGGMGGFRPGGFMPGGFNNQGNNNNRGGRQGSGGRTSRANDGRGPDFFAERVTDDPQPTVLYDPQLDRSASSSVLAFEEEQQQPPPTAGNVRAPSTNVTIDSLPELGAVVITAGNAADIEALEQIIKLLQDIARGAETELKIVYLQHADATALTATLSQLFQRVQIGPSGTTLNQAPTRSTTATFGPGSVTQTSQGPTSIVLLPLTRFNAILVAAPRARMEDIEKEIKKFDQPSTPQGQAKPFPLKKASAPRVATLLNNWYAQRYPGETAQLHQIRITSEDSSNTVFVQAGPSDMNEIADLIQWVDNTWSAAINDLRVIPLRNALADELAQILQQAISAEIVPATTTGGGIVPGAGAAGGLGAGGGLGAAGAQGGGFPGGGFPGGGFPGGAGAGGGFAGAAGAAGFQGGAGAAGAAGAAGGLAGQAGAARAGQTGVATKTTTLRFFSLRQKGPQGVESGLLEDVHITPDTRTNSLLIAAPSRSMDLLVEVIRDLDQPPAARAQINIFQLKRSDASTTANLLQQLFLGTGATGTGTTARPGGVPGAPGTGPTIPGATGTSGATRPLTPLSLSGTTPEGAPLVEFRITVDVRTNSILVAGSQSDLDIVYALITKLEDSEIPDRHSEVYHLHNAAAADVANALTNFLTSSLNVLQVSQQLTAYQEIEKQVVIVPEPVSNKLLISASPNYFGDLMRLIMEIDAEPPQVVIQALVAEVDLSNTEEFGVELGLQSPVLFQRSVVPSAGAFGTNGTVNYATPAVASGVTVNSTINPAANPGFGFNSNSGISLIPNNPLAGPGVVGFQGLGNLGTGRVSPTSQIGGFVFSAASDSFSLLIRALKTQGRIDILSRPQIMTADNQSARILVGQSVPYVTGSTVSALGNTTNLINYRDVGVQLTVTPRISPEGKVLMRVTPEISSVQSTTVNLGNGVNATQFNVQSVDTTVLAQDGETVAIGGLIAKKEDKNENKIPWFGDLPAVGALFRYRTQSKTKTELIVILTPHIVRNRCEAERILAEEERRISWVVGDVIKFHGTTGVPPSPPADNVGHPGGPVVAPPAVVGPAPTPVQLPANPGTVPPRPLPLPTTPPNPIPGPTSSSGAGSARPAATPPPQTSSGNGPDLSITAVDSSSPVPVSTPVPTNAAPAADASPDKGKESRKWNLLRRNP
jgi:type II secretion system protein D